MVKSFSCDLLDVLDSARREIENKDKKSKVSLIIYSVSICKDFLLFTIKTIIIRHSQDSQEKLPDINIHRIIEG